MRQQLNSDELLVALEGLCEFYTCPETTPSLTPSHEFGGWLAHLAVTVEFCGPHVFHSPSSHLMYARGATLRECLERLHDAFVAAAPSFETTAKAV
ncbi:hypothetical protein [Rhodococcus sp. SMB37]|uniref:hypothetical protein n=1 Tax=Rhodococcus sp. SMB37 TaxID=2512213 RepID=UPI00104E6CC5|nr:hypothetical protein [Rhodococcus sp. SMB37]